MRTAPVFFVPTQPRHSNRSQQSSTQGDQSFPSFGWRFHSRFGHGRFAIVEHLKLRKTLELPRFLPKNGRSDVSAVSEMSIESVIGAPDGLSLQAPNRMQADKTGILDIMEILCTEPRRWQIVVAIGVPGSLWSHPNRFLSGPVKAVPFVQVGISETSKMYCCPSTSI